MSRTENLALLPWETMARMDLTQADRDRVEKLARAIASKMLHNPMRYLKSESCRKGDELKIDMVRTVFGLEDDDSEK